MLDAKCKSLQHSYVQVHRSYSWQQIQSQSFQLVISDQNPGASTSISFAPSPPFVFYRLCEVVTYLYLKICADLSKEILEGFYQPCYFITAWCQEFYSAVIVCFHSTSCFVYPILSEKRHVL